MIYIYKEDTHVDYERASLIEPYSVFRRRQEALGCIYKTPKRSNKRIGKIEVTTEDGRHHKF